MDQACLSVGRLLFGDEEIVLHFTRLTDFEVWTKSFTTVDWNLAL